MRILVTGSSGFIGSSLLKKLKGKIVLYDRNHDSRETLNNKKLLKKKLIGVDLVYHLAGISNPNSADLYNVNVIGTKNLVDVINSLKQDTKVIFASTFGVYKIPKKGDFINENYPIDSRNEYGKTKIEAEKLILKNNQNIILRFSNIYGQNMPAGQHSVVANFIDSILNQKTVKVLEKNTTRDFIYVDDVVEALVKALSLKNGGIFNICTNKETSIINLIKIIEKETNKKFIIDFSTPLTGSGYWRGNYNKAEKALNWKPRVNIVEGISKIVNER